MNNHLFIKFKTIGIRYLLIKIVLFLSVWSGSLYLIDKEYPDLIDWSKLVTSTYANTLAFLVAYILTVVGFRYSSKKD
jgi:hypothetical protein